MIKYMNWLIYIEENSMSFKMKKYAAAFFISLIGCILVDDTKTIFGILMLIWAVNVEKMEEKPADGKG